MENYLCFHQDEHRDGRASPRFGTMPPAGSRLPGTGTRNISMLRGAGLLVGAGPALRWGSGEALPGNLGRATAGCRTSLRAKCTRFRDGQTEALHRNKTALVSGYIQRKPENRRAQESRHHDTLSRGASALALGQFPPI